MANGTAPIEASTRRVVRHRLNRGGNRQLNKALRTAAIAQIRGPGTEGHAYYQRCLQRGKTKREATHALKRRISDRIWTHLQHTNPSPRFDIEAHPPAPPLHSPNGFTAQDAREHRRPQALLCPKRRA